MSSPFMAHIPKFGRQLPDKNNQNQNHHQKKNSYMLPKIVPKNNQLADDNDEEENNKKALNRINRKIQKEKDDARVKSKQSSSPSSSSSSSPVKTITNTSPTKAYNKSELEDIKKQARIRALEHANNQSLSHDKNNNNNNETDENFDNDFSLNHGSHLHKKLYKLENQLRSIFPLKYDTKQYYVFYVNPKYIVIIYIFFLFLSPPFPLYLR